MKRNTKSSRGSGAGGGSGGMGGGKPPGDGGRSGRTPSGGGPAARGRRGKTQEDDGESDSDDHASGQSLVERIVLHDSTQYDNIVPGRRFSGFSSSPLIRPSTS